MIKELSITMMIGEFRRLLQDYHFYIKDNFSNQFTTDLYSTYMILIFKKFTVIHKIRRKCMHWEDIGEGKSTHWMSRI